MSNAGAGSSASCIIATSTSGYHILKVDGYSHTKASTPNGQHIKSRPFTLGGYSWHILYYPNGRGDESVDYISIFLHLKDPKPTVTVKAQYKFRFLDEVEEQKAPSWRSERIVKFDSITGCGNALFIKTKDFEKSKHLRDDSFTIRCDINIVDRRKEVMPVEVAATPAFVSVPPSDLHRHLNDLLRTEKGADVAFEVGGETFRAHRCVLASRSPVFDAELFGPMKESHGTVRIEDIDAPVFRALLCFLYTDSLPEMGEEDEAAMAQHLLVAADRYGMERLKLICEDKLYRRIEASNAATILALAEQHHCHGLKKACFHFLKSPGQQQKDKGGQVMFQSDKIEEEKEEEQKEDDDDEEDPLRRVLLNSLALLQAMARD